MNQESNKSGENTTKKHRIEGIRVLMKEPGIEEPRH